MIRRPIVIGGTYEARRIKPQDSGVWMWYSVFPFSEGARKTPRMAIDQSKQRHQEISVVDVSLL
jgi:hypothetical protein